MRLHNYTLILALAIASTAAASANAGVQCQNGQTDTTGGQNSGSQGTISTPSEGTYAGLPCYTSYNPNTSSGTSAYLVWDSAAGEYIIRSRPGGTTLGEMVFLNNN